LDADPAVTGQPATVSAAVTTTHGYPVDGGVLTLSEGERQLGEQPVTSGAAELSVVLGAGPHELTATYSGRSGVAASTSHLTLEVSKASQAVELADLPALAYGDAPVTLAATASSGLPVTFTAAGACSVVGTALTPVGVGTCTVTAAQSGDTETDAAQDVVRTVEVAKTPQTVAFPSLPELVYGGGPVTLAATSTSGLAVAYAADGACSVTGSRLTLTAPGDCAVTATQSGDDLTAEAPAVTQASPVARTPQDVVVGPLQPATFGDAPQVLRATATSGLPVTWTAQGACSVTGAVLTFTGTGPCTVVAAQEGDEEFAPADDVSRELVVATPAQRLTLALDAGLGTVAADAPVTVRGSGLLPGSTVVLEVHSTPRTIATGTVGSDGRYTMTAALPTDLEEGAHELVATGTGVDGTPVASRLGFTVGANRTLTRIADRAVFVPAPEAALGPAAAPAAAAAPVRTVASLPRTGVAAGQTVGAALLSLGLGTVLLVATTRRRRQA
jgi:hypothetical protein